MFLPGLLFAVGLPAVQIVRDAAQAAQLKAEIDAAGPNDPRRAEQRGRVRRGSRRGSTGKTTSPKLRSRSSPPSPVPFVPPAPQDQPFESPEYRASKAAPVVRFRHRPALRRPLPGLVDAPAAIPTPGIDGVVAAPTSTPPDPNLVTNALSDLKAAEPGRRKGALDAAEDSASGPDAQGRGGRRRSSRCYLTRDRGCRAEAARALASWGGKENTPALVKVLNDTDIESREAALDALAALKDPSAAEAVAARLTDTRDKAAPALKAIGRPAAEAAVHRST